MLTLNVQARAIAAAALAFALVIGDLNRIGLAVVSLVSKIDGNNLSPRGASSVIDVVLLVVGVLILVLAASASGAETAAWPRGLAQAARLVALVGIAIYALDLVDEIVGAGYYSPIGGGMPYTG